MSKNTTSYQIANNLFLVSQQVSATAPAKPVETPTNHLAVIDCSGSMSCELPKLVKQLKTKLAKLLVNPADTLSMIWFSGRGQTGVLFEAEPVATLKDLDGIHKLIERWLKPVGLTGFKEPLDEAAKLAGRLVKKNGHPVALFFMSDGHDNCFSRPEILKAVETAAGGLASTTFVEYGYYADRALLTAMAEKSGGQLIHASSFDAYEPVFEAALARRNTSSGKRVEVKISGDAVCGFAWTADDTELVTYGVEGGAVRVPVGVTNVYYLSPTAVGTTEIRKTQGAFYAAVSLFSVRMKPDIVWPILKLLGDTYFIEFFGRCFGKQKYSEFMDAAKAAAFDSKLQLRAGYDPTKVPDDNAFTVLDLLRVLSEDESARLLLDHPEFKYSRISRGRVDADENLSADESLALEVVRAQMAGEKSAKKLKELQAEIDKILSAKKDALKFDADPALDGYEISSLVYNECSPNVSVKVRKTGVVDLSSRPEHASLNLPTQFKTHIWRNYAIVSHGLVNVDKLPVTVSRTTYEKLKTAGVQMEHTTQTSHSAFDMAQSGVPSPRDRVVEHVIVDVKPLPIINRAMVKAVSAADMIKLEWQLLKQQAAQKVFKHYTNELFPGLKMAGFTETYGEQGAVWLKDNGLTSNGFAPKSVNAPSIDFIVGKELNIKLKGYSTLPKVEDAKVKQNPPGQLMKDVIDDVDAWLKKSPKNLHQKWLSGKTDASIAETRSLIFQTAVQKWSILVGGVWFNEFVSLDDNVLSVKVDGKDVVGTCELREIQIKV